jgi:hypothetical protein
MVVSIFRDNIVQCWGSLICSDHQLYNVTPLKTPFGLVIPLFIIPITRINIHSQLFLTLLHIYTIIILTRSWLQSLITLLHWLTSQLSITVSNYHRLYIFTRWNSRRELTQRIHFLRLLLTNSFFTVTPGTELDRLKLRLYTRAVLAVS